MPIFHRKPSVEKLGAQRDVQGLIEALNHKDQIVRSDAAVALGNIGDARAVEPLIQALKDEEQPVRYRAAVALGNIGDARAIDPLSQAAEEEGVKYPAEEALAKIRGYELEEAECPVCGSEMGVWEGLELNCQCGVILRVEAGRLLEEGYQEVADSPEYGVSLLPYDTSVPQLRPALSIKWPLYCCIDLAPVSESDFYEVSAEKSAGSDAIWEYVSELKMAAPYCKNCVGHGEKQGVLIAYWDWPDQDLQKARPVITKVRLLFRNPQYARMFREANQANLWPGE